ncbi:MAG: HAD family hydrolase [Pseudomonadota bacterium]
MPDSPLRGLLFDKDGTLFDFTASWAAVVEETLAAVSRSDAEADMMAREVGYERADRTFVPGSPIVASSVDEFSAIWARTRTDLGTARIEALANSIVEKAVAAGNLVAAVPDLAGFLAGLRASGYFLGVATHDSEGATVDQLSRYNALDLFDFIAGYDSGHGLKPGPGMMHAFCTATGLRPAECAMIGDSTHDLGVKASSNAALAIGVLTGPAQREDLLPHADHVIDSIASLPELLSAHAVAAREV